MKPVGYLTEHADLDTHQYAIIDRVLFKQLPESLPVIELVTPLLAPQAHIYPWLVPLREVGGAQWKNLMSDANAATDAATMPLMGLLLKSELSPEEIKKSLLDMLIIRDADQHNHVLRFYDPRVLFHLQWMLSGWEFFHRFNVQKIQCWTFWLEGQWQTLSYPQRPSYEAGSEQNPFTQLQRIGQINRALAELPRSPDLYSRQKMSQRIDALLQQCPLKAETDKVAFALHGVTYGEDFWKAEKMMELLKEAQGVQGYYARLTSSWREDDWKAALKRINQAKGNLL